MKNLKRTLSLALAVVMMLSVFGMMTFASATNYSDITDKEDITNTEAVSLLVDLGIIEGYSDGSFKPTQTITRGEMTKLITMLVAGNVDASSFVGTTTDLTDINGHWAEGYIKYCYASGYVAGQGNGIFAPDAKITVVEAAKMLNVAIGYDATKQGYEYNSNWSVNIMRDASGSGIMGNVSLASTASLDRDTAALMMYNALFAKEVYYLDFISSSSTYSHTMGLSRYGLVKVEGIVTNYTSSSVTINGTPYSISGATYDAFLKTGVLYAKYSTQSGSSNGFVTSLAANKLLSVYSSELLINDDTVVYSSVYGDSAADLEEDGEIALDSDVKYYVNKSLISASAVKDIDWWFGSLAEFIDNDGNGYVDYVKITDYAGATVAAYSSTSVTFSGKLSATATAANVIGYANIAKGDVVTVVEVQEGSTTKYYVSPTEVVSGSVTRYSSSYGIQVDGNYYLPADNAIDITEVAFASSDSGSAVTLYVDQHEMVYYATKTSAVTNYAYVGAVTDSADLYGRYQAILYFSDGTNQSVYVKFATTTPATTPADVRGKIVKYTLSSSVYTLREPSGVSFTNVSYEQKASLSIGGVSLVVSTSTIYVDTASGKAYTGRLNIPKTTITNGIYLANSSREIIIMFATDTSSSSITNYEYFLYTNSISGTYYDDDGNLVYQYRAIVDGVLKTIDVNGAFPSTANFKKGLYSYIITTDEYGYVNADSIDPDYAPSSYSEFTALADYPYTLGSYSSSVVLLNSRVGTSTVSYALSSDTVVFLYTGSGAPTVSSLANIADTDCLFVSQTDGVVDYIIAYRAPKA